MRTLNEVVDHDEGRASALRSLLGVGFDVDAIVIGALLDLDVDRGPRDGAERL